MNQNINISLNFGNSEHFIQKKESKILSKYLYTHAVDDADLNYDIKSHPLYPKSIDQQKKV